MIDSVADAVFNAYFLSVSRMFPDSSNRPIPEKSSYFNKDEWAKIDTNDAKTIVPMPGVEPGSTRSMLSMKAGDASPM